jgi:hypothetical protein
MEDDASATESDVALSLPLILSLIAFLMDALIGLGIRALMAMNPPCIIS